MYEIIKLENGISIRQTDKETEYKTIDDVIEYLKNKERNCKDCVSWICEYAEENKK